jgi:hypothetical protein
MSQRRASRTPATISWERFQEIADADGGFCTACGAEAYGVEPDATGYPCEHCGEAAVFGAEELVLRGDLLIALAGESAHDA